jgi:hypothetical protein
MNTQWTQQNTATNDTHLFAAGGQRDNQHDFDKVKTYLRCATNSSPSDAEGRCSEDQEVLSQATASYSP